MDIQETIDEMDTPELMALAIGVGVLGLIVLVVLTVVLAAVVGTFVLGAGEDIENQVNAGVSVSGDAETNEITVTFTSNQNADYLVVEWTASGGSVGVTGTSGDASEDGQGVRLSSVGSAVALSDGDPDAETSGTVTVTAVGTDDRSVILTSEFTV